MTADRPWEEISGFRSAIEFENFESWLAELLAAGTAREVSVGARYAKQWFGERWILHGKTGETWRVVTPDFPFKGLFAPVDPQNPAATS